MQKYDNFEYELDGMNLRYNQSKPKVKTYWSESDLA